MRLSRSPYDLDCGFDMLTQVDLSFFFNVLFFLISSFDIILIRN
jgi:hypothetical protein